MRTRTANVAVAKFAPFSPAVVAFVMFVVWVVQSGGYFPGLWYPSAMVAVSLFVATVLAGGRPLPDQPAARVALLAYAALVAFSYLSITWAGSRGAALEASNKLLLYLALAWSLALLPWTPRSLALAVCLWSTAIGVVCLLGLVRAIGAVHLDPFFVQLRYATPLDYPNATGALAVMGLWPALLFSCSRELPRWARVVLLALAVFLAEFSLLPQSRAAVLGLVLTAPLALALAGDRLRLLPRMALVGAGLALTARSTLHVDNTIDRHGNVGPVLQHAAHLIFITSAAALILGTLLILAETRLEDVRVRVGRPRAVSRAPMRFGRRGWIAVAVIAVAALAAAAPSAEHLVNTISRQGRTDASVNGRNTRLLSVAPEERLDYIRVAWKVFKSAPLIGVGAGNFAPRYDALRRFPKHSKYVHDVALRTLSETGVVGFLLFVVIVAALAAGLVRRSVAAAGLSRACAVAALLVAAYFLVHASLDWIDEFPALAVPALAFPLAAIGITDGDRRPPWEWVDRAGMVLADLGSRAAVRVAAYSALVLVGVALVVVALGLPYVSQQYVNTALRGYKARPATAYADLSRAADLNPWSTAPLLTEGQIAEQLRDPTRARAAFKRVLGLEQDWYAWFQLGLIDAQGGRFKRAATELRIAAKLDVDDPVIAKARTMIRHHRRIDPRQFNVLLTQGVNASLFSTENIR